MSFMKPDIHRSEQCYSIDTTEGTFIVPHHVCGDDPEGLEPFYTGQPLGGAEVINGGFVARLSAPGYMDCTEWSHFMYWTDVAEWLIEEDFNPREYEPQESTAAKTD